MNTYRKCKAKHDVKAGELVDMTTVEVLGKPVHVPTEADSPDALQYIYGIDEGDGKDYSASLIMAGMACGRMRAATLVAKGMQDRHEKFMVHVRDLRELDYFIEQGIQPSNIHMNDEDYKYHWTEFGVLYDFYTKTPDGIIKA